MIEEVRVRYDVKEASFEGSKMHRKETKLAQLKGIFIDDDAFDALDADTIIYEVEWHDNGLKEGTIGGLFLGVSHVHAGKIGNEFYMTRGHLHLKEDTGEYYWGLKGYGLLVMSGPNGESIIQKIEPQSLHYIPGNYAHRLVNTGAETLSVGACWQTESGHNYQASQNRFKKRIFSISDEVKVVDVSK